MKEWLKNAVFYEIYPQSFFDTNGDGIGDLEGIIRKLDYIKDLGFNALWINPCFESPFHDAGYDISNYYKIAPRYGTNEDARRLFSEVHKREMHILFDLVPGHTSIEHEWFQKSMKSTESNPNEFHGRYIWTGTPWEHIEGVSNVRGELNGFCERGNCAVNFFTTQPALNYGFLNPEPDKNWQSGMDSPEARATKEALWDIMKFWLSMGVDGFRIDMAGAMIKGDDEKSTGTVLFWQEIRDRLRENFPDAAIVSEWGEPDKSLQAGFDMDFLLHFGPSHYNDLFRENPYFAGKGDLTEFWKYYDGVSEKAGKDGLICIPSGNHDMSRISYKLTTDELKLAFTFLLTMPGAPFVYYGDEIGMRYMENQPSVEGGYERTGSRTPMQWDTTLNAGFSSAPENEIYLPIDEDTERPNVSEQLNDEKSLLNFVKKLVHLRLETRELWNDSPITFVMRGGKDEPLVYIRGQDEENDNAGVLVAINPFDKDIEVEDPRDKNKIILKAKSGVIR